MIKVANVRIETGIELTEDFVSLLIVESPCEYYRFVKQLLCAFEGETSEFTFWDGVTQLSPQKEGEILTNIFSFDFSDRKILSLLYKKLNNNYLQGAYLLEFSELNTKVGAFLQNICATVDFALDYNELCLDDLLKVCSVKPAKTYTSLLEKIICYINLFVELKNIKFFVFTGLKDVLSDDDLMSLYHHCALNKVSLLLLESSKKRKLLPCERAIIITEDLCEILENYN